MWIIEKNQKNKKNHQIKYSKEQLAEFGEIIFLNKILLIESSNRPHDNGEGIVISEYEAHTLLLIKRNHNITAMQVAKKLGVLSTLSSLIFKLCTAGYITKNVNPKNRREHFLTLTPLGEKVCKIHHALDAKIMRNSLDKMLEYCTLKDFETFIKVTKIRNEIFSSNSDNDSEANTFWGC